jgi:hypothetical protein
MDFYNYTKNISQPMVNPSYMNMNSTHLHIIPYNELKNSMIYGVILLMLQKTWKDVDDEILICTFFGRNIFYLLKLLV